MNGWLLFVGGILDDSRPVALWQKGLCGGSGSRAPFLAGFPPRAGAAAARR